MIALRIVGLVSIAALTMGSGAPTASDSEIDETATTYEIEEVDAAASSGVATASSSSTAGDQGEPEPLMAGEDSSASAAGTSTAGSLLEIALTDDYIQAKYFPEKSILGFDEAKGHVGAYISDDRDLIGFVGAMTDPAQMFIDNLTFSFGARGYLALLASPNDDVFGVAPGVEARYPLPVPLPVPVTAVGSLYYAPDILTLGDAENIVDIDARGELEISPGIVGFGGYRVFRFDSDEVSDKKAANEFQFGARFAF